MKFKDFEGFPGPVRTQCLEASSKHNKQQNLTRLRSDIREKRRTRQPTFRRKVNERTLEGAKGDDEKDGPQNSGIDLGIVSGVYTRVDSKRMRKNVSRMVSQN